LIEQHQLEIDLENSFAYADSLGDIHLLEMVGNPVAVFPDEHLKPVVERRGWPVID
jgi:phosphoserine phosphatase